MKKNLKIILIIASVALNAVFAATYAICKLPVFAGVQQAATSGPLFLQLDLTPGQLTQLRAERDKFHAQLQALSLEVKTKQLELIDLLTAKPPEPPAIEKKQEEIQRMQRTVQERVIVHFLQASSFLSPEQQTRFFRLIKERIEMGSPGCSPWLRPFEQGEAGGSKND